MNEQHTKTDAEKLADLRAALTGFRARVTEMSIAAGLPDEVWAGLRLLVSAMTAAIGPGGPPERPAAKLSPGSLNYLRTIAVMGQRQLEVRRDVQVLVHPDELAALLDAQVEGVVEIVQVALAGGCSCSEPGCVHDQVRQVHDRAVAEARRAAADETLEQVRAAWERALQDVELGAAPPHAPVSLAVTVRDEASPALASVSAALRRCVTCGQPENDHKQLHPFFPVPTVGTGGARVIQRRPPRAGAGGIES